MELAQYLRILRARRLVFAACVVACVVAAGLLAALKTPVYEARATLFVSSGGASRDLDQTYEGGLLAQQRARSYAELVSSPRVAQAVVEDLGLRESPAQVQRRLTASVPVDTVLIDVTASAASPQEAQALADAVTAQLPRFVDDLETAQDGRPPPVTLSVASRPQLPTDPASPRAPVYLALGLLLGVALGVAAAVLRDALDDRVRTDEEAATTAGLPVLGSFVDPSPDSYRQLWRALSARTARDGGRLLLTSIGAEGATSRAALGLGVACAEAGRSVVLVDANLMRPNLSDLLQAPPSDGLAGVLLDGVPVEDALQPWERDARIEVLPAGARSQPASDVLGTGQVAKLMGSLADRADVVIVDVACVDRTADAAVLGPLMSGVVLVMRLRDTRAPQLEAAIRELAAVGAEVHGLVTIAPAASRSRWRGNRVRAFPAAISPAAGPVGVRTGSGR
jgi:succinoglycan biosynthesis transport protein ExoP